MKQGFTLIEMLLGIVIVSLLTGLLFAILFQTNRAVRMIDRMVDGHTSIMVLQQLMTRDLAGVTIPLQYREQQQEERKSQKNKKEKQSAVVQPQEKKSLLTHVFYSDTRDSMMHELTFITTNPLPSYWDGVIGKAKPRIVRVTYRLRLDEQRAGKKPLYTLVREESAHLTYLQETAQEEKPSRAYTVLHTIRRMSITYSALVPVESVQKTSSSPSAREQRVYTNQAWNVERDGGTQELLAQGIIVPQLIKIEITIDQGGREESYSFSVAPQAQGVYPQQPTQTTPASAVPPTVPEQLQQVALPASAATLPSEGRATPIRSQETQQMAAPQIQKSPQEQRMSPVQQGAP